MTDDRLDRQSVCRVSAGTVFPGSSKEMLPFFPHPKQTIKIPPRYFVGGTYIGRSKCPGTWQERRPRDLEFGAACPCVA
jgi:hypothetical protein